MLTTSPRFRVHGYSLVELMVAISISLILTSAVTSLVVANMRNTNNVVRGMRVTEESRALTEIITRELRRVRYDASATSHIGSGTTGTVFNAITPSTVNVASDCIKYSYDANGDPTINTGEFRMFSRGTTASGRGVVRYGQFDTEAAVDCTAGTVITSEDIDVGCLRFMANTAITLKSSDAVTCFPPSAPLVDPLVSVPAGSLYFSLRMGLETDPLSVASRRTDAMIMIRSPVIGP